MIKILYKNTVPLIQPVQLAKRLGSEAPITLLDVRSEKEYRVSHLQGAHLVSYETFDENQTQSLPREREIVVYCSVGYRSERIGERLQQMGFENIRNLYGGIFEWVNQGFPVYSDHKRTARIHAYSKIWGVWLMRGEKVYD